MKAKLFFFFASFGLAIAGQQKEPEARAANAYTKDNHNLKYVNNIPMDKTSEQVKIENKQSS